MNTVNTIIMPSTIPEEAIIRQLLLFSDAVSQFAPSEDSVNTATVAAFKNCYSHYPPVPFGQQLATFQKFFKDLTSHRAEYRAGGLSHLSSGLATDIDESSVWLLINKLAQATSSQPKSETLMHARLLLKLAEIQHTEEKEIDTALSAVDSQMGQIFSELKNEEGRQIDKTPPDENQPQNANQPQLLKAWFHLFLADQTNNTYPVIATDYGTFTTLNEYASPLISPQQNIFCSLSIPDKCLSGSQEEFNELRNQFQQTGQSEIKQLQSTLIKAATTGILPTEKDVAEFNTAFENASGREPSTHNHTLTLYAVPLSLPQLASRVLKTTIDDKTRNSPTNTIIAVIAP